MRNAKIFGLVGLLAGGFLAFLLIPLNVWAGRDGCPPQAAQAILCVNVGGTGGCYSSIQAAVNAAGNGDTIRVAQGVYAEAVVVAKSVTLEGGWNAAFSARDWDAFVTTIDAQRSGSVIQVHGGVTVTVEGFVITGGEGVGVVTRPGLDLAVGQAAINPVPRRMIRQALRQAWRQAGPADREPRLQVTIIAPQGLRLARHTLNPRLGIEGGISILGTTGLVKPFSHAAYIATIDSGLKVAISSGVREVVLTTGRRSEKRAMALRPDLPELAFIQMADFFSHAMGEAARLGLRKIGLVSFFGKAVKQAMALPCTHAHRAPMDLDRLARWLGEAGAPRELTRQVAGANTARHSLEVLRLAGRLDLAPEVGRRMLGAMRRFAGPGPELWAVMMDYDHSLLFEDALPGRETP